MYEALKMILTDTAPALTGTVPGMTPALDAVLARCLAKDPDARYPNGLALAEAVTTLFTVGR
jgi:serine/threonine-protein kinase